MSSPKLRSWLGGAPGPILVLAALNMADEFDRIAFSALSPEIRDRFDLQDSEILMLNVVPGIVILLTAALVGYLVDRHNRILLSLCAAAGWGAASLGTGLAPSLGVLIGVRILSGLGRSANEIIHPSVVADLYPEPVHPRAFLIHRLGNPLAQVSGVVAGFIAASLGWTWAFYLLVIPTIVLSIALSRLTDPPRRKRETDVAGSSVSLLAGVAQLARLRSFPRLWLGAGFLGAASFGIFGLASIYFEKEFGFGPKGRGFVQFVIGSGWFVGVLIGGRFASRSTLSGNYRRLVALSATSFSLVAASAGALALVRFEVGALLIVFVLAMGNGVWQAPFFSAVAKLAPPSLSGQAFGSSATAYALGSFLIVPIALLADNTRRGAFGLVGLFGAVAGIAAWSVTRTIDEDLAKVTDIYPAH
jgi:predicted MFS family arabinose efflux permease